MSVGASGVGVRREEGKAFIPKEQHVQKVLRTFYRNWELGRGLGFLDEVNQRLEDCKGQFFKDIHCQNNEFPFDSKCKGKLMKTGSIMIKAMVFKRSLCRDNELAKVKEGRQIIGVVQVIDDHGENRKAGKKQKGSR